MHMLYTLKFGVLLFLWDFVYLCVCVCPLWFSKFLTLIRCYFYSQGKELKGFFFSSVYLRDMESAKKKTVIIFSPPGINY